MDDSSDDVSVEDSGEEEMYWCGEVVEVDETSGRIFVSIQNPDQEPTTGTFYVRPFEFLGLLNEVYNSRKFADVRDLLPARLVPPEAAYIRDWAARSARACPRSSRCGTTPGESSGGLPARERRTASASKSPAASMTPTSASWSSRRRTRPSTGPRSRSAKRAVRWAAPPARRAASSGSARASTSSASTRWGWTT